MMPVTKINDELCSIPFPESEDIVQIWTKKVGPLRKDKVPKWIEFDIFRIEDFQGQKGNVYARNVRFYPKTA